MHPIAAIRASRFADPCRDGRSPAVGGGEVRGRRRRQRARGGLQGEPRPSVEPPFSFVYQGKPSADFLKNWRTERVSKKLGDGGTARTTTYSDPATGLEVRCDAVEYSEYPAVEWILHFKNTGTKDTGIIENILPMDLSLTRGSSEFVVHHAKGSCNNIADFQPIDDVLAANAKLQIQSDPWPSTTALPFFNVECGRTRDHRGHRLDGGLGGQLRQGRGKVAFREGRAEPRALRPPSRRGGPQPADARPLLERRPDPRPQSLASALAEAL